MEVEEFLTKSRYKHEIADFLKVSRSQLNDFIAFYNVKEMQCTRRLFAPFEIRKLFEKLGML